MVSIVGKINENACPLFIESEKKFFKILRILCTFTNIELQRNLEFPSNICIVSDVIGWKLVDKYIFYYYYS